MTGASRYRRLFRRWDQAGTNSAAKSPSAPASCQSPSSQICREAPQQSRAKAGRPRLPDVHIRLLGCRVEADSDLGAIGDVHLVAGVPRLTVSAARTDFGAPFVDGCLNPRLSGAGSKRCCKIWRRLRGSMSFSAEAIFRGHRTDGGKTAGRQTTVKAVSRRRRGPKTRLYSGLPSSPNRVEG